MLSRLRVGDVTPRAHYDYITRMMSHVRNTHTLHRRRIECPAEVTKDKSTLSHWRLSNIDSYKIMRHTLELTLIII